MRTKTLKKLQTELKTVEEAKKFDNVTEGAFDLPDKGGKLDDSMLDLSELTKYINYAFIKIDDANKLDLLESLFQSYLNSICANDKKLLNRFGQNFLHIYIESVKKLHKEDKDNIVSHFAKCFQLRENSDLTRLPIGQMPNGLLDYVEKFFSSERTNNLVCEPD